MEIFKSGSLVLQREECAGSMHACIRVCIWLGSAGRVGGGGASSVAFDAPKERHRASDHKKTRKLYYLFCHRMFAYLLTPLFHYSSLINTSAACHAAWKSCLCSFLGASPAYKYPFQLIAVAVVLFWFIKSFF